MIEAVFGGISWDQATGGSLLNPVAVMMGDNIVFTRCADAGYEISPYARLPFSMELVTRVVPIVEITYGADLLGICCPRTQAAFRLFCPG